MELDVGTVQPRWSGGALTHLGIIFSYLEDDLAGGKSVNIRHCPLLGESFLFVSKNLIFIKVHFHKFKKGQS